MFPATFGLACCAIEMMSIVGARVDVARFGGEAFRASPRQADLLVLSGRVSIKMAPVVRRIYDQMLEPRWAIAMGACSSSMGVFNNYAIVPADKFMPVDMHVPGCPPRPEALMHGILKLRAMILAKPDLSWRSRYGGRGTEEFVESELAILGDGRECLTRPASSCSPRTCARRTATTPSLGTEFFREQGRARHHARARVETLAFLRERGFGFLASVHGARLLPRRAAPRRAVRDARHVRASTASRSGCGCRSTPPRAVGHARTGRPPTTRSARSTTCSA